VIAAKSTHQRRVRCNVLKCNSRAAGLLWASSPQPSPPKEEREKPRALRLFNSAVAVVPDCNP